MSAMPYFYVITIQWVPEPGAASCVTSYGTYHPPRAFTRLDAFRDILARETKAAGLPEGAKANTLFFSLEPNALPEA
ncbi:hypothetical protein [Actinomadura luteofluorescens]|uniref:hypothetical protein n=1 Tax=Actinomadura luteofluorescens TaxID=46163 RepID=UPI003D8C1BD3